ncbi:MAG TPA: hypothetical protein VFB41_02415 [Solirubrobacteraceae bacterium]|nr:hypothetical protein [Solirubrobacteraceae bacterium]
MPRRHRLLVSTLLVLGTLFLLAGSLAVWINRQALQTDHWVDTSTSLLRDPAIQSATAAYLAEQLFAGDTAVDRVRERLPDQAKPLAPAVAGALSDVAERAARRALASDAFQQLWENANRISHQRLVAVIEGDATGPAAQVVLDLRPMLGRLATRVGLGDEAVAKLPNDSGIVHVLDRDELDSVRGYVDLFKKLVWVLIVLTVACFAGAVALAGGRRAHVLAWVGLDFVIVALLLLLVRRFAGNQVVDAATGGGATHDAATATWAIGTSLLRDSATSVLLLGSGLAAGAWLAGTSARAGSARRRIAPYLIDQPGISTAAGAVAVLLLLAWGPFPMTQTLLGALVFVVALAGGLFALRQAIVEESPSRPTPSPTG